MGKWNWWMPTWLDRLLPHISLETSADIAAEEDGAGQGPATQTDSSREPVPAA